MPIRKTYIGENINPWLLVLSLLMVWGGSVVSSRFDSWYTIIGGAAIATLGCYLNLRSVKWVTESKKEEGSKEESGVYIKQ
jgi:hypothetical protein